MTTRANDSAIQPTPGNIEAALVRLEGKMDRIIDNQTRQAEDVKLVRERLHDHANILTTFTALNVPEKLNKLSMQHEAHESRLNALENDLQQRKGAMSVMRALWALIGLIGGGGVLAIVKLAGGM